jgi:nicotinate dehydrogenase subunit A
VPDFDLLINGSRRRVETSPSESLLTVLREHLDLTGSKYGCGEAQCGACTVLVDGKARRSCVTQVRAVAGKKITTIEGLETNGRLHPVQQAFIDHEALQCGYCTPGMIMSAVALLSKKTAASEADITSAMDRNICRCGTYPRIVAAVRAAARPTGGGK